MSCRICGNDEGNKKYIAKEMMYGFRDEFEYMKCSNCGCLQLVNIPDDLSKYYPNDYYFHDIKLMRTNKIVKQLRIWRDEYALFRKGLIGKILYRFSRKILEDLSTFALILTPTQLKKLLKRHQKE